MGKAYDKAEDAYTRSATAYLGANSYPCTHNMLIDFLSLIPSSVYFILQSKLACVYSHPTHNTFQGSRRCSWCVQGT